jgi:hypothetical protein
MKTLMQFLCVGLLTACASAPQAKSAVDVSVVNRGNGQRLEVYRHGGRLYVAGTPGDKYAVRLKNRTSERILTVLSVDGVNAVSGETAAPSQTGYVLDGSSAAEISGWRKSMQEVAAFVFTALPESYAARTGRPENVGVIGVAVFRERPAPRPPLSTPSLSESKHAAEAPAAAGATADSAAARTLRKEERLGTGHGERETAPVTYTEFKRASEQPAEVIRIYYDSYANLVARGVIPRPSAREPNPFPGRFVPDPWG